MRRRSGAAAATPAPPAPQPAEQPRAEHEDLVVLDGAVGEVAYSPALFERLGLAIVRLDELGRLPVNGARLDALRAQIARRLDRRRERARKRRS